MTLRTAAIEFRPTPPLDAGEFGNTLVLATVPGLDPGLALDAAMDLLDAVHGALLELVQMGDQQSSRLAALSLYANETAQALVRSVIEGKEVPDA
ncbi:hypothetical protein H3221_016540 [Pseudomonas sp. LMG 31766]|jgi:hypothetical protein|uniref:DUF3077 domain-containing protein n=1 Tax=Pseudomonas chaetocerotis TaxID=2758695 RepID=A0A931D7C9_9PSED|nr:hypothetical protein [Pseudomonas chaetocerotis]MBZ9666353.1 hypothetical protein [Pseudomonas chaetocerotis]